MNLARFKKLCDLSSKKSDWEGRSYMCIVNRFRDNANSGYQHGDLTAKQRDSLIQQGFLKTRKNGEEEEIIPWKDWNNKG